MTSVTRISESKAVRFGRRPATAFVLSGMLVIGAMLIVLWQYGQKFHSGYQDYAAAVSSPASLELIQSLFHTAQHSRELALSTTDSQLRNLLMEQARTADQQIGRELEQWATLVTSVGEIQLLKRLRRQRLELTDCFDQLLAETQMPISGNLTDRFLRDSRYGREQILATLSRLRELHGIQLQKRFDDWQAQSARSFWQMAGVLAALVLAGGCLAWFLCQARLTAAAESEHLLQGVLDALSEPLFVLDEKHNVCLLNTACRVRMGRREEEVIGRPLLEAFPFLAGTDLALTISEVTPATGLRIIPQTTLTGGGSAEYEIRVIPFSHEITVAARDITRQKRIEQSVRQREEQFRAMFFSSPLPMMVCDRNTQEIIEVNDQFIQCYGYSRMELLRMRLTDLRRPEDGSEWLQTLLHPRNGVLSQVEEQHRRRNQSLIIVQLTGSLMNWQEREAVIVAVQDITVRKRTESVLQLREAQLHEAKKFTDQIISNAGEGIMVADLWMRHLLWNRRMEDLTGIPAREATGRQAEDNLPGLSQEVLEKCHRQALKGEIVISPDFLLLRPEGTEIRLFATFAPNRNVAGEIIGTIALVREVFPHKPINDAQDSAQEAHHYSASGTCQI